MLETSIDIRDALFDAVYDLAINDKELIFITGDMGAFSLEKFKKNLPDQYINAGIAEQNIIGLAAGLALEGRNVFVYALAPFITMRCYEQIKIDISSMHLPVKMLGSGPGFTYSQDGPTHNVVQDVAIIRAIPGVVIFNPSDQVSAKNIIKISYKCQSPVYIRIDKGELPRLYSNDYDFSDGLSLLKKGNDLLIITTGIMVHQAFKLADELAKYSIDAGIVDIYRIKPINDQLLLSFIGQVSRIITLEEHSIIGGIGSIVSEILVDNGKIMPVKKFAVADKYIDRYGDREWTWSAYGLDVSSIVNEILNWNKILKV